MVICGIDYSLSSPALCFFEQTQQQTAISPNLCQYYFFDTKCTKWSSNNVYCTTKLKYDDQIERYTLLANWAIDKIQRYDDVGVVVIEDYAFTAKGRVFNIAENCGILKYQLYHNNINFTTISPTNIKKMATGKGNAKKEDMYEAWLYEKGMDLVQPSKNPSSDIVDSYFLCKYGSINKDVLISG